MVTVGRHSGELVADVLDTELYGANRYMYIDDVAFLLVQQSLSYRRLNGDLPLPRIGFVRTDYGVAHTLVVAKIEQFHLRQELYGVASELLLGQHTGMSQNTKKAILTMRNPGNASPMHANRGNRCGGSRSA